MHSESELLPRQSPLGYQARVHRFVEEVHRARRRGVLPPTFTPGDLEQACPGWDPHTYSMLLPKHRQGNPGGHTEYFVRNEDGTYSLM
jgi:hypothetical protein